MTPRVRCGCGGTWTDATFDRHSTTQQHRAWEQRKADLRREFDEDDFYERRRELRGGR